MKTDASDQRLSDPPIAVVGMDCRFPGAIDLQAYWDLLINGRQADATIPTSRWDATALYSSEGGPGAMNTTVAHFIDDPDAFDNDFFGISPLEADALDPQQRLALQATWRAIEDAGIDPRSLAGTMTGVYAGVMSSEWSSLHMLDYPGITAFRGTGIGYCMVANRISYQLNLCGPSMAIDTACSSSLMAVHQACSALRLRQIDLAVVVGVNLLLTPALSIFYTQAGLSAPDGRCKPFGAAANGIGRGEGVGAVVLSRLADATSRHLPIYAVVAGTAANQDGRSNGITAPSRRAQVAVMQRALAAAAAEPADIAFVEGHGTGTVLGDMIEVNALGDVHTDRRDDACYIGSVKGNIGHTEGAAGVAAFIKAALSLHHGQVPPTLFGTRPNPGLRLDQQRLAVNEVPAALRTDGMVGVSSFGLGGSNVHILLQRPPEVPAATDGFVPPREPQGIVAVSANTVAGLRRNIDGLLNCIETSPPDSFPAIAHTSVVVKASGRHRVVACGDRTHCLDLLGDYASGLLEQGISSKPATSERPRVGLLCTGQGAQYYGMTRAIYANSRVYRGYFDNVCAHLNAPIDGIPLDESHTVDTLLDAADVVSTVIAQPALFAVSYALGRTILDLGLDPAFLIGHSVGELAAAALAGALTLDDAARIVRARAFLMNSLPVGGIMAVIGVSESTAEQLIQAHPFTSIAAVNAPGAVVISGPFDEIADVAYTVIQDGGKYKKLHVSHAFHSPLMRTIVRRFKELIAGIEARVPNIRLISTVRGGLPIGPDNLMDVEYWADQIVQPVRFAQAVTAAMNAGSVDYLCELGPRTTLIGHARRNGIPTSVPSLVTCEGPSSTGDEFTKISGQLIADGFRPRIGLLGEHSTTLTRIPPYKFDTTARFWLETPRLHAHSSARHAVEDGGHRSELDPLEDAPMTEEPDRRRTLDDELIELIADVGGYETHEIRPDQLFSEDLGYDSLIQLRLIDRLRSVYPSLASMDLAAVLPDIQTVGDLMKVVGAELDTAGLR